MDLLLCKFIFKHIKQKYRYKKIYICIAKIVKGERRDK